MHLDWENFDFAMIFLRCPSTNSPFRNIISSHFLCEMRLIEYENKNTRVY